MIYNGRCFVKKIKIMILAVAISAMTLVPISSHAVMPCGGAGIDWGATITDLIDSIMDMVKSVTTVDIAQGNPADIVGIRGSLSNLGYDANAVKSVMEFTTKAGKGYLVNFKDGKAVMLRKDAKGNVRVDKSMSNVQFRPLIK